MSMSSSRTDIIKEVMFQKVWVSILMKNVEEINPT